MEFPIFIGMIVSPTISCDREMKRKPFHPAVGDFRMVAGIGEPDV